MKTRLNQSTGSIMQTRNTPHVCAGIYALIVSALLSFAVQAAPGEIDPFFGTNGRVISRINNTATDEIVTDAAMQPDGKIVTVGYCVRSGSETRFCITRHTANGVLDNTFGDVGSGGTSILISPDESYATSVALQRDGKIVVGGYCGTSDTTGAGNGYDMCLARLLTNGKLDTSAQYWAATKSSTRWC
jgi:uncharacterized delta-60 repeat protein